MAETCIYVVDDDADVRAFLERLISSRDLRVLALDSAKAFLEAYDPKIPGCLLLDIGLPEMSGLELQAELVERGIEIPIVILTGESDASTARTAFKAGIVDFVQKPFQNEDLLSSIDEALLADAQARANRAALEDAMSRFERLTPRENEVVALMVQGKSTKEIAFELGLSPKTIDVHRANSMRKMRVTSVAEMVRLALKRDPNPTAPSK